MVCVGAQGGVVAEGMAKQGAAVVGGNGGQKSKDVGHAAEDEQD
jgi:hypothetical protein